MALHISGFDMSGETWSLLFCSLSTHPRITLVSLDDNSTVLSAELKTIWVNAILQMLHHNTVVHTIALPEDFNDERVYRNSILPRLEMNRTCFEVQRQAVKRADKASHQDLFRQIVYLLLPRALFRSSSLTSFSSYIIICSGIKLVATSRKDLHICIRSTQHYSVRSSPYIYPISKEEGEGK
jgi:hypothetical protein